MNLLHIDAVVAQLAVGNVIKTIDEIRDGGLSGTGGAHQSDLLTGLRVDGDVMQNGLFLGIAKIHIFENHIALQRLVICLSGILMIMLPGPAAGPFAAFCQRAVLLMRIHQHHIALVLLRRGIQQPEDTLRTGQCHDHVVELHADLVDGHGEALVEGQEAGQGADGEANTLVQRKETAHEGTEHIAGVAQLCIDGPENIGEGICLPGTLVEILVQLVKVPDGGLLVTEDLDHLFAAHGFLDKAVQGTQIPLLQNEIPAGNGAGQTGAEEHQHHHADRQQREHRAQHQHHGKDTENRNAGIEHLGQRLADHLPQGVDIVRVDGHNVAVGVGVEEADGKGFHVVKEVLTEMHHAALGDLCHETGLQVDCTHTEGVEAGHPKNGQSQRTEIRLGRGQQRGNVAVNEGLGEHGSLHAGQYGYDDAAHHQKEPQAIIFHNIGEKPQEKLSRVLYLGTGTLAPAGRTPHGPCILIGHHFLHSAVSTAFLYFYFSALSKSALLPIWESHTSR